jgi:hypothetical protein
MAYLTNDYLNERRSAYRTAARAAAVNDGTATHSTVPLKNRLKAQRTHE